MRRKTRLKPVPTALRSVMTLCIMSYHSRTYPLYNRAKSPEHCALFTISRIKPKAIHLITAGCWNSNIALR
ncbi:Uncharacterised protein [Vibrio cholerae]|nr:Uncharacterised protein [Vibrio cholerae]CSI61015.1 Uncharacterised protein [Vibrio cholerae]